MSVIARPLRRHYVIIILLRARANERRVPSALTGDRARAPGHHSPGPTRYRSTTKTTKRPAYTRVRFADALCFSLLLFLTATIAERGPKPVLTCDSRSERAKQYLSCAELEFLRFIYDPHSCATKQEDVRAMNDSSTSSFISCFGRIKNIPKDSHLTSVCLLFCVSYVVKQKKIIRIFPSTGFRFNDFNFLIPEPWLFLKETGNGSGKKEQDRSLVVSEEIIEYAT